MTLTTDAEIQRLHDEAKSRIAECDYCGRVAVLSTFMPEKYAVDNYSPSSLSLDELEDLCSSCVRRYCVSHDPKIKRKTPIGPVPPYRWL